MMTLNLIEGLMAHKFGRMVEKYRDSPDGEKLLMEKLKSVLSREVETLLRLNGMVNPPFDPFKIHDIGKAPVRVEYKKGIGSHGTLEVVDGKFVVTLESDLLKNIGNSKANYRLRSTMAHELMHTFFYDTSEIPPRKLGFDAPTRHHLLMQEELCYFLSRQLLVPTFSIKGQTGKYRYLQYPSIKSIRSFKSIYRVSSDIIAYRLINDLHFWKAIFAKFVRKGDSYTAITRLKTKTDRFYDQLRIPRVIPSSSPSIWEKTLMAHVSRTREKVNRDIISISGRKVILESSCDSRNPASVITLIYESEESSYNLSRFIQ